MVVPTIESFEDVYPSDAKTVQSKRWNKLLASFEKQYGNKAEFVSRSPGRVNIIGEHIDYSLYQVIPMAVTVDVLLAVYPTTSSSPKIRLANVDSRFPAREFNLPTDGSDIEIDAESHEWSNYFKSGLRGAVELLRKKNKGKEVQCAGMDLLVDGSVPAGGGLSSSAAFVCASALAVMRANGEEVVDKTELVELAIVSERAVGVNSGGMDQSASVFALRDSALVVSFKPSLTATPITIPETDPSFVFMIAQSFVVADKHVTAPIHYNLRVVECTLAALALHKLLGLSKPLPRDDSPLGVSLRGLHDTYFEETENITDNTKTPAEKFQSQLEKLIQLTTDHLDSEEGYTLPDLSTLLGTSEADLTSRYCTKFPVRCTSYLLRQRALHVFTEALRVQKFLSLLQQTDPAPTPSALADLLNQTQSSCATLYDCSCPELDDLCRIARDAGALGSRLTGAGWGGCSVHLVPADKVAAVTKAWEEEYYRKRFPEITEEKLGEAVVVSRPGRGSLVWEVKGRGKV